MNFAVRKRRAPSIIIVSLVDILTILLIFFVVSTTFKKDQPEVQINLPESKTATKAPAELEHAIVTVDEDGEPRRLDEQAKFRFALAKRVFRQLLSGDVQDRGQHARLSVERHEAG